MEHDPKWCRDQATDLSLDDWDAESISALLTAHADLIERHAKLLKAARKVVSADASHDLDQSTIDALSEACKEG